MADAGSTPAPPGRLVGSPVVLLIGLGRIAQRHLDEELARDGLSLRHLGALGHLSRTPGLSYSELARRAGVTVQSMQATVGQLEVLGAVARPAGGGRGRAADLRVTAAGDAVLERAEEVVAALEDRLLATLPADERAALAATLAQLLRAAWGRLGP